METPNEVKLSNGSYLLFDTKDGTYRVAFYERRVARSGDLLQAVASAMKKREWDKQVKEVVKFIEERFAATSA